MDFGNKEQNVSSESDENASSSRCLSDLNLNRNRGFSSISPSSKRAQFCRKCSSLPPHYKPPSLLRNASFRISRKDAIIRSVQAIKNAKPRNNEVSPIQFRQKFSLMKDWYREFNDEQKCLVLKDLMNDLEPLQLHFCSLALENRLHADCHPNCQDPMQWIPEDLVLLIFSYLDPASLARASQVCRFWHSIATLNCLWKRLCHLPKWRLSVESHREQIRKLCVDGQVSWKKVMAERYRLRRNWFGAHCHIRTFSGHTEGISCVQFNASRIVSGSHDNTIKVWNRKTNSQWPVQTLVGHSGRIRCLHLSENRIISGSADKTIKVWVIEETSEWSSITCQVTMVGHTDTVRCLQAKGSIVVSGSYDKSIRVWALPTGRCLSILQGHEGPVLSVEFEGKTLVSGSFDQTIKVWSLETEQGLKVLTGHNQAVTTVAFDQTRIISGSLDCTIRIWCIDTGCCLHVLDWMSSEGHTGVVRHLSVDSWRIVSASDDKTIKVWDRHSGKRLVTLRNHTDGVTCLAFDDYIIVSGSYDRTVKLWDFGVC